jgi:hypothetical protein
VKAETCMITSFYLYSKVFEKSLPVFKNFGKLNTSNTIYHVQLIDVKGICSFCGGIVEHHCLNSLFTKSFVMLKCMLDFISSRKFLMLI